MADTKISDLTEATSLVDTDLFVIAQEDTANKKATFATVRGEVLPAFASYTPALTASVSNPTLGSGSTAIGYYIQIGDLVHVTIFIIFGTSGTAAGSGTYRISLPINVHADMGAFLRIGYGSIADATGLNYAVFPNRGAASAAYVELFFDGSASQVAHNVPFAWAASDALMFSAIYKAA